MSCEEAWWQRVLTRWHTSHREQRSDRDMVTTLSELVTEIYNYNRPLSLASEILARWHWTWTIVPRLLSFFPTVTHIDHLFSLL